MPASPGVFVSSEENERRLRGKHVKHKQEGDKLAGMAGR